VTTETTHTRSRRASLGGLILQVVTSLALFGLAFSTRSQAALQLAFYALGGVPIWFVTLLVFRQRELAALEALDLEELRREKQATGAGAAIFGEEGPGGLGYRVAETRAKWMQRWLVPGFALATAAYLAVIGIFVWHGIPKPGTFWAPIVHTPFAIVGLAIFMIGTFLYARYTSGMAHTAEWQLLRGCGAYLLGNSLAMMALMIAFGVLAYSPTTTSVEHVLAYVFPVLMWLLAAETTINFVLDIYRPRTPGVEPRAAYDSRLLGLLAEPGGIASSIAEALNYQFGFQVSQTWFYQLLARAFVPLLLTGVLALWLLTGVVIVQPYERVIIERFGTQLNPGGVDANGQPRPQPLMPGLHFKLPAPIDRARAYNTGQLHQISIGFSQWDAVPDYEKDRKGVQLWTDTQHLGLDHFNFLVGISQKSEEESATAPARAPEAVTSRAPVHMMRMEVVIQYRICADELYRYSRVMTEPDRKLRDAAWSEVVRYAASTTVDDLLSRDLAALGEFLRKRINERTRDLGLEVAYVGVTNIHPETTVANAFREVIGAEQQKVAAIREARVTENQKLSEVAGDVTRARTLAKTTVRGQEAVKRLNEALAGLQDVDPAKLEQLAARVLDAKSEFVADTVAAADWDDASEHEQQVKLDYQLGLGQTLGAQAAAAQRVQDAKAARDKAAAVLEAKLGPVRTALGQQIRPEQVELLVASVAARLAVEHWEQKLDEQIANRDVGGTLAARLAAALADRWDKEMTTAARFARAENEREAYRAAPEVYKSRRLMEVYVDGLKDARKFFLAFDPTGRVVRTRLIAEDERGLAPEELAAPK